MSGGETNKLDLDPAAKATQILLNMLGIKSGLSLQTIDKSGTEGVTSLPGTSTVDYSINGKSDVVVNMIDIKDNDYDDDNHDHGRANDNDDAKIVNDHELVSSQDLFSQNISFTGADEKNSFPVYGSDVTVWCNSDVLTSGSSKVKIKNIVNASWDSRYYYGQQVVVNSTCEYVAYSIKLAESVDGAIRVTRFKTKQRVLLRGMQGAVVDLAFAHCIDEIILASVDQFGTLFVHSISVPDNKELVGQSLLTVRRSDVTASFYRRVVWCHYIPEDENTHDEDDDDDIDDDDGGGGGGNGGNGFINKYDMFKRLAVINNNTADIFNVEIVVKEHGSELLNIKDISSGHQLIEAHSQSITGATFSPDGTVLATISCDGKVKFFEINVHKIKEQSACLHQWNPHDGKPLSCLFFLDDHSSAKPEDQFWKFAITGADMNRELKVWNCALWTCLQTIRFNVPMGLLPYPEMKAGIDITASYLFMSDVRRNVLYVLNIYLDVDKNIAQISCVSEFPLMSPILSYAIRSASRKKFRTITDDDQFDEGIYAGDNLMVEIDDEHKEVKEGVVIKLIYVQPKSLQKCAITYHPSLAISNTIESVSSFTLDTISSFKDRLSDLNYDTCSSDALTGLDLSNNQNILPFKSFTTEIQSTLNNNVLSTIDHRDDATVSVENDLMSHIDSTPIETSPHPKLDTEMSTPMNEEGSVSSERSCTSNENKEDGDDEDDETIVVSYDHVRRGIGMVVHSNGSSPSLEVQEILNKDINDENMEFIKQNLTEKHLTVNDDDDEVRSLAAVMDLNDLLGLGSHNVGASNNRASAKAKSLSPQPTFTDQHENNLSGSKHLMKWPTAPGVPDYGQRKRRTIRVSPKPTLVAADHSNQPNMRKGVTSEMTSDQSDFILRSIWALMQTVESQKCELQSLRQMMVEFKTETEESASSRTLANEMLQRNIVASMNTQLQKRRKDDNVLISNLLKNHNERLVSSLMQTVSGTVMTRLDGTILSEFRNSILPNVMREVETMKNTMQTELVKKLATTDNLMRENINRIVENKSVTSGIAHAVSASIRDSTRNAFNEALQNVVIPAFEKSCQAMFHQISDAFHKGSTDYTHHLEKSVERQRKDGQALMMTQIQGAVKNIQSSTETVASNCAQEMDKKLRETLNTFENGLSERLSSLVQKEMNIAIKEHQVAIGSTVANAIRSRAVTPVPSSPMERSAVQQAHILQLLQRGELNGAFQQALSASDLNLVMFVCEKVNAARVFGEIPCPLKQPVLLSLIHQLSADLSTRTELKHDYLQEALVIVDVDDPITCSHVPIVMEALQTNLRQYIKNNPGNKLTRNIKVLLMATESMFHRLRKSNATAASNSSVVSDLFSSYTMCAESPIYE